MRVCGDYREFMGNISDTDQQPPAPDQQPPAPDQQPPAPDQQPSAPAPNSHRPTRLRVFNVEKDLTRVQCGSTRWNIHVKDRESDYKIYAIVGVVVGSVALLILVILILYWCWRRERRSRNNQRATTVAIDEKKGSPEVVIYTKDVFYTDIKMKEGLNYEAPPPYSSLQSTPRETII
ncbi:hypothetical protein Btru_067297 [Bulinus truncatus]|nr:hypothetical protein Btru_067297 [Bulinus truncatus]